MFEILNFWIFYFSMTTQLFTFYTHCGAHFGFDADSTFFYLVII